MKLGHHSLGAVFIIIVLLINPFLSGNESATEAVSLIK